jgi:dihydroxyacid dehydratase/phosphogluconate dehydratase
MSGNGDAPALRSTSWFGAHDLPGFLHRASVKAIGYSRAAMDGRPVVGICNPWSEVVNCNVHFRGLAEAVRRGVLAGRRAAARVPRLLAR